MTNETDALEFTKEGGGSLLSVWIRCAHSES